VERTFMKRVFGRIASVLAIVVLVTVIIAGRHALLWSPTERVTIASGDVALAGTIAYPDSPGPHPAILMLHGSGPEARLDFPDRAVVNALTDAGFAVLFYDKRGVGESGGNFDDGSSTLPGVRTSSRTGLDFMSLVKVAGLPRRSPHVPHMSALYSTRSDHRLAGSKRLPGKYATT
jgi:pimeloyl-ACP methyl ester carboxylesterase